MATAPSIIHRILDLAFNRGDLSIVDELVATGAHPLEPWSMSVSRMGLKQLIASYRIAFPDLRCTVEDEIRQGQRMAARWTMRGTHTGPFFGNPPTGRSIVVQGIIFANTRDGRITEDWILIDQMAVLQQLGIIPPPRGH